MRAPHSAPTDKVTILTLQEKKQRREVVTMLTAYDYTTAQALDQAGVDAILVGAETLRADNPQLTVRGVSGARQPWRVVVTRSGNLPKKLRPPRSRSICVIWRRTSSVMPKASCRRRRAGGCFRVTGYARAGRRLETTSAATNSWIVPEIFPPDSISSSP